MKGRKIRKVAVTDHALNPGAHCCRGWGLVFQVGCCRVLGCSSGQGPHLAKRWEPRGFSRVAVQSIGSQRVRHDWSIVVFCSPRSWSCDGPRGGQYVPLCSSRRCSHSGRASAPSALGSVFSYQTQGPSPPSLFSETRRKQAVLAGNSGDTWSR